MLWEKRGQVFAVAGRDALRHSHAALPCGHPVPGHGFRVYYSSRDRKNRARVFHLDLDLANFAYGPTVLAHSGVPDVDLGPAGAFDDSGATVSTVVPHGNDLYLYYSGWSLGVTVPFYFYIGLAVSTDGGATFEKVSGAPVLGRSAADPFLTASPAVLVENGTWRMWYVSGIGWLGRGARREPSYHIKYAESADGVTWKPRGRVCLDFDNPGEVAFGRPCVLKHGNAYRMWYCMRGDAYRIGYAESSDGLEWTRKDSEAGMAPSDQGWDSQMQAYPFVFEHAGLLVMLYNGNGYGKTGFGMALARW